MGRQTRRGTRYGHLLKMIQVTKSPRLNCYVFSFVVLEKSYKELYNIKKLIKSYIKLYNRRTE